MENSLNINELIKIDNLPKIYEQLETIGRWVDDGLAKLDLDNLVVDEEHKQEIKKARTEVNNISKLLEDKRKEIKTKILEPYAAFETKYNEEVKMKLANASETLGNAINEIEYGQKVQKETELRQFFDNYNEDYHLEKIIKFEDVGLNITLSASMKSLKDQIVEFFKKVSDDFQTISSCDYREEVLMEYQSNGFNYSQAVNTVNLKHKQMEELQQTIDNKVALEEVEQTVIENVETLVSAPIEVVEEEILECTFKVKATKAQLIELKKYLQEKGISYE